ncbi:MULTISPECIES: nuclear transport factor 2 family protein [Mycolicibacterium]|uniref:DUF4440 domain-containing protein n=3 Tax=Mycolicibacterium fortuitum TaxID=1766 RepID=A0A1A2HRY6_MYCFO|nr:MULTISPECIES: nuclear transport factor 2 family protein [Mycolicibacterium]AIY45855.1 hypothetical protein G155_10090 [Mycobacterium sp. VKM Ac-1817D]CRL76501.1 ketosteroid isomerase-like protein [Mycolicibacter nonchromogenicus]AMD56425.1 DUF4440 domain-containing protein [Mycolicibacterium fortuitum subsp. fortuitum DSM 46621 = ATCC 6841 = JCM 6387]MCA4755178.1 nuclear transport factor 2 family protein [Mycolicibacterium fortuitum]MCV7143048.1 nuclear transport factor 2 family protein [My
MPPTEAAVVDDVAHRLFDAIERGDKAAVARLWADDVAVWHAGDAKDNDRTRALKVIDWFINTTSERRYDVLDRQFFDGGFVQQHVLHAGAPDGTTIALRVCIVIRVGNDGLIHRIDEYFDPKDIAPLFT